MEDYTLPQDNDLPNGGDDRDDERPCSYWIGFLLVALSGFLFLLALFSLPLVLRAFTGREDWSSIERFQLALAGMGIGACGVLVFLWGGYELLFRKRGPLLLVSVLCVLPLLVPFWFLGYGSDHDAWTVARTALRIDATGAYEMSRPPGFPLFEILASWIVPRWQWPGLLLANAFAGFLTCLLPLALPAGVAVWKKRLLSLGILVQPLFLLGCGVGLDYIWQTLFIFASAVFLVRGLCSEERGAAWVLVAGLALGVASGFRISSLGVLPVFAIVVFFFGGGGTRRFLSWSLFVLVVLATALICELPVFLNYGFSGLRVHPDEPRGIVIAYRLVRYVFPPPMLLLLLASAIGIIVRWGRFERAERILLSLSAGVVVLTVPAYFLLPREPGYLTFLVPFLAAFGALLAARWVQAPLVPALLVWCFVSIPVFNPELGAPSFLKLKPEAGPLVEEAAQRFKKMRQAQQLFNIAPKEKTAVLVAFDWAMLSALRPGWEVEGEGFLRNPHHPAEYYIWLDREKFEAMKAEGYRFLVVGSAGRFTRVKYGYDPLEKGAVLWTPKIRFYR